MCIAVMTLLVSAAASAAQGSPSPAGAFATRQIGDVAAFSPASVDVKSSDAVAGKRLISTPAPVVALNTASSAWQGQYFNNTWFGGSPRLSRSDTAINFDWYGSPGPGIREDYFSVRWTRTLNLAAGTYRFSFTHDDYGRLFVDGQLVMRQWYMQVPTNYTADYPLSAGAHTVTVEYYTTWGEAVARVGISQLSSAVPTATSTPQLAPTAVPTMTPTPTPTASSLQSQGQQSPSTQGGGVVPTPTNTSTVAKSTPAPTNTSAPTPTSTTAPPPTNTPTAAPPTNTPLPTNTPAPAPTATVPPPPAAAGTRDKYAWPCASTSIWNMPIGSAAAYVPANIQPANGWGGAITTDDEIIDLNPNDPLKPLNGGGLVHVGPTMSHDGSWNGVAAFLKADGNGVAQGQPLVLSPGGNPFWSYNYPTVDIRGDCIAGAHGGSGLSSFGGSIRKGELSSSQPLHHALKVNLFAKRFLSQAAGGYRWPASHADGYALSGGGCPAYGGGVPALRMGSLLALPPGTDLSWIGSPRARKIAQALMDYGAYVVDDTCWDVHAIDIEAGAEFGDGGSFNSDLQQVFTMLAVVDNNGPSSIGGGGTPRVPLAPPIGN